MSNKATLAARAGLLVALTMIVFWTVMLLFTEASAEERPPVNPGPRPTISPSEEDVSGYKAKGSIRGAVHEDRDGDGSCASAGDHALPGIPLELTIADYSLALLSGDDGTYAPVAMGLGTWKVAVKPPPGWRVTSQNYREAFLSNEQLLVLGVDFCLAREGAALPLLLPSVQPPTSGIDAIPAQSTTESPSVPSWSTPVGSYVVQPGDYLLRICRQFGYTLDELVTYNHIVDPNLIYPGQVILFPSG